MARTAAVGEKVLVRLALLPGMKEEDEPEPEEIMKMKLGLRDPAMLQQMLEGARESQENPDLTADALTEQIALYPRIRPATIAYVDRTEGPTGFVNLDVFTPGSYELQPAIGKIPKYATQHFRLDHVQFMTREPEEGGHEQHIAFWPPEAEEDAPTRLERKKK